MKKLFLILSILISLQASAQQQISVKSFTRLDNDMEARLNSVEDQNGDKCALIKIRTTQTGFAFEGGSLGIVKTIQKIGEIWVYIPAKAKFITILHTELGGLRNYQYPQTIIAATVYDMELVTGTVEHVVKEPEIISQWVVITTEPSGADVYINEESMKATPFQQEMKEGKYTYRISKDLYYPEAGQFELIAAQGKKTLNFDLRPNFGYAEITSTPVPGAQITLDGKLLSQTTPFKTGILRSGEHTVVLTLHTYHPATRKFTVTDDIITPVEVELLPAFGSINISSSPESNAEVSIDGEVTGKSTPCTIGQLMGGEHAITVRHQWYEPKTAKINVIDGQSVDVNFDMQPIYSEISITTEPEADIYIDDQKTGFGNYTGRLLAGLHTFEARKDRHISDIQKVELIRGGSQRIGLQPKPITGTLKIITDPIDATITLSDKDFGTSPITIRNLLVGDYNLTISKDGYSKVQKNISIKENQTLELREELSSGLMVTLNSKPSGAMLIVDGQTQGNTPKTLSLKYGKHPVAIRADGYEDFHETINITDGGNTSFNFQLRSSLYTDMKKYKRRTTIWLITSGLCFASTKVTDMLSEQAYSDYKTAGDDATNLHNRTDLLNVAAIGFAGAAVACLIPTSINYTKKKQIKKQIELGVSPLKGGATVGLCMTF